MTQMHMFYVGCGGGLLGGKCCSARCSFVSLSYFDAHMNMHAHTSMDACASVSTCLTYTRLRPHM